MMAPPEMSVSLHLKHLPVGSYEVTVTGSGGWFRLIFPLLYNTVNSQATGTQVFHEKIEIPSQVLLEKGSPSSQVTSTPTTFPKFKELPGEIRSQIWVHAIQNDSRIFYPTHYDHDRELPHVAFAHKPPPIRQVCRESRQISQKRGMFIFGTDRTTRKALWFDTFNDIMCDMNPAFDEFDCMVAASDYDRVLNSARNVAVDWMFQYDLKELLESVVNRFKSCQTIYLAHGIIEIPEGDIAFYAVPDEELVEALKGELKPCGQLKDEIRKFWHNQKVAQGSTITKAHFPSIVVVEAIPVRENKRN
jgi:hypothetical protein